MYLDLLFLITPHGVAEMLVKDTNVHVCPEITCIMAKNNTYVHVNVLFKNKNLSYFLVSFHTGSYLN